MDPELKQAFLNLESAIRENTRVMLDFKKDLVKNAQVKELKQNHAALIKKGRETLNGLLAKGV